MASKTKTRDITITNEEGAFKTFFKRFYASEEEFDFEGLSVLRRILSNEKARLLHTIKHRKPGSLYELAKVLNRDFKAVVEDIKLLERFGFIELVAEKSGKRKRIKPIVIVDSMQINVKI